MDSHSLSRSRPLELYFIPFLSPGHLLPLFEIARLFSNRGESVTFITTPANADLLRKTIDKDVAAGRRIATHVIAFPSEEVGLPNGVENLFHAKDYDTATKIFTGMTLLQQRIEEFMDARRPDAIVSDMFHPWTADVALRLGVPRLVFYGNCFFAVCLKEAVRRPDSPHLKVQSDDEPFVIPGLPDPITMTRSMLPDYVRTPNGYTQMMEEIRESGLRSYGAIFNDFYEFDPAYGELYKKTISEKMFHVGPVGLIHRNDEEKVERGHKTVVGEHECLSFLDSKKPHSVLYICFGSGCIFPNDQLMEIACGLEASGHQFIWVVFDKPENESEEEREKWLPRGFDERTKDKGMIIKGWAPQLLILDHPSVAAFLTHCGWNSVLEGVSAGVPLITWPLYAEHFYNEKCVTQVLGVGVEVGKMDWQLWVDAAKTVVTRDKIERAVRKVMDGGDPEAEVIRRKANELGEKARNSVQEGGSSHRSLSILIEELKELSDQRVREIVA